MSQESWAIVIVGFLATWVIGRSLDQISAKIDTLIGIAHRIRINDRERDF